LGAACFACGPAASRRPNILFAISDDQSWLHMGATGDPVVKTPGFDRVAESGVLFRQAFSMSPGCAPSRASILTGRPHWQLEEAGTHASYFPKKLTVYPDLLKAAGYHVGITAKGAGPCNWKASGWEHNPAGSSYDERKLADRPEGINRTDYAGNFADFLQAREKGQPFYFWYGGTEPHRTYRKGAGVASGKKLRDVVVPPFLPDTPEVRNDLLDYYTEIEHFDRHLGQMLDLLEREGELENTVVVATSDNGMPFPRAKANMYEYGIHLPLAIAWPGHAKGGRVCDDIISFVDFAPTFLEAAGLEPSEVMTARSVLGLLRSGKSGRIEPERRKALSGRERHSHSRYDNLGYPNRALRTEQYLYIWNMKPDLWPAGDPPGYHDVDAAPTKQYMVEHREDPEVRPLFDLAFGKRPEEELFDIQKDPGCMKNLAEEADYGETRKQLRTEMEKDLRELKDPRVLETGDIFESYPRFNRMRPALGGFSKHGEYNPKYQKK
jgi:uncharacterized sulfatase